MEGETLLAGSLKPSGSPGLEKKESKSRRPGLFCAFSGPGGVALTLAASSTGLCKELGRARGGRRHEAASAGASAFGLNFLTIFLSIFSLFIYFVSHMLGKDGRATFFFIFFFPAN